MKLYKLGTLALAGLLTVVTVACRTPGISSTVSTVSTAARPKSSSPEPDSGKVAVNSDESAAVIGSDTVVEVALDNQIACVTWSEYQASDLSQTQVPQMPPGFEEGCILKVGQSRGSSIDILRNGIGFDRITTSTTTTPSYESEPIPWFQASDLNDQFTAIREMGDLITYYAAACTTIGNQISNCDGFPEDRAYILDNTTACFQGQCLQVPNVHGIYLLSLWDWMPTIEDRPTSFSPEQTAVRNQYQTVPLNQLSPDVPLYGSPTDIAMRAFGRTTLEEGEKDTVITGPEWDESDAVHTVYVTNEGLADDSVGGYRYRLDFVSVDGDLSELLWVGKQWSCRRGSSAGEWTGTGLCP